MYPIKSFLERFGGILAELDALTEDCAPEAAEDLDDLNAELEDALLLLGELKKEDGEELAGALEDIQALAEDYRALADQIPALAGLAGQLDMAADMALGNLADR
ncbi:MAG: hypothetical protein IJ769_02230 [Clostridia bacterium]|nr:hypothetical protein [Clostridia bacterium]